MTAWHLYICDKRNRLYVGITTNLKNRLKQHGDPILRYVEGPMTRDNAVSRERQIKGWSRGKKIALINRTPGKPR